VERVPRRSLIVLSLVVAAGCGKGRTPSATPAGSAEAGPAAPASGAPAGSAEANPAATAADSAAADAAGAALPPHTRHATLADALRQTIPADARVLGFGELHARVDRARVRSALAAFTEALPSFGERVSDLVVETWIVDPRCGQQAVTATRKLETEVKRPETTKSEIALLADAAGAAKIQPHAMTLSCKDYEALAPAGGSPDPVVMLGLVTRELSRIATSAIRHRDKQPGHRPWIAVYGGALHNDRFPAAGVAEWSYAAAVEAASAGRYVELDVIVPEFAELDPASQRQPWFPLVAAADRVLVWTRGERSFVVILPRTPGGAPPSPTRPGGAPPSQAGSAGATP
jgi:hypothetical protein